MWVCRLCETENPDNGSVCICCGHGKLESEKIGNNVGEKSIKNNISSIIKKSPVLTAFFAIAVILLICFFTIHIWTPETCTEPETCSLCGKVRTPASGHNWMGATCTESQECLRCGAIGNSVLGHKWANATCTEPQRCLRCGEIGNPSLGHNWSQATYEEPNTCTRCGQQTGQVKGYVGAIKGKWSEYSLYIRGSQSTHAYELSQVVENCFKMTMDIDISDFSGYPFDSWYLYARDLNGNWSHVGEFNIEESTVYEPQIISFSFDPAISFDALTILQRDNNQYRISYSLSFYDVQKYID